MKKLFLLILLLVAGFKIACAQVSAIDTMGYRMSVVSNVKDVALVTGMSVTEQITLANFFKNAEDTLNGAVNSGDSDSALQIIQNQLIVQFQSILTSQELASYRQQRKNSIYAQVLSTSN